MGPAARTQQKREKNTEDVVDVRRYGPLAISGNILLLSRKRGTFEVQFNGVVNYFLFLFKHLYISFNKATDLTQHDFAM